MVGRGIETGHGGGRRYRDWSTPAWVALAFVALVAAYLGQDANWDLRNYHLYTPSAVLDGRYGQDIAAAQLQSWHNPTLDFPLARLVRAGAPGWLVTLWLSLPAFVALLFALRLMDTLWPAGRGAARTVVAGLVGASGAAAMSATGASFNDAFVAAGVLPALWWMADSMGRRGPWATWLPIGLLAGAVAGMKLTAATYCVGFIAAALFGGPWRGMPARLLALALGGGLAALLFAGPWAWHLWNAHGNPLFPYFNDVFQSPDALSHAYKDMRFVPKTWGDRLLVPVHLLSESARYSELKLSDPRALLGMLALAGWLPLARRATAAVGAPQQRLDRFWPVIAFVVASHACWAALYGIYRYYYPLELLLGISAVGVLSAAPLKRLRIPALVMLALLAIGLTNRPNWSRQPFRAPMIEVQFPALPADALVVLSGDAPLGHAVAFLPADVPAISVHNNFMDPERCTRLQQHAESRIRNHAGPLFLLREAAPGAASSTRFQAYGLEASGSCLPVTDSLVEVELCPLQKVRISAPICAGPAPGR